MRMKKKVAVRVSLPTHLLFASGSLALFAKLDLSLFFFKKKRDNANATPYDYSNLKTDRMRCRESTLPFFFFVLFFLFVFFVFFPFRTIFHHLLLELERQ